MIYIIANEKHLKNKKNAKKPDEVKSIFENAGKECEILYTKNAGDAKAFTQKITSQNGEHTVVAMGGDGTLHEIINGFENFEKCSLGLIPFGSGNDFASCANLPSDVRKAAEIIAYGTPRPIDYIQLSSGLRSINAVGTGIDVDVLKRAYSGKRRGKSKYFWALISSLIHFKSSNFTVRYNGKEEKHFGMIAAIGNGRQIGGGIKLFPEAKIDDGYLDLFLVDFISRPKILGAFIKLMRGKVNKIKATTAVRVKSAEFIHEDENFTIQAEGELYDNIPIEAHIVEGQLKFYLP